MTFYSIMGSISHLGKMARTAAKSENPTKAKINSLLQSIYLNSKWFLLLM